MKRFRYDAAAIHPNKVPPREMIEQVIEAGRAASSGANSQTTHMIVITKRKVLDELAPMVQEAFAAMEVGPEAYVSLCHSVSAAKRGGYVFHYGAPVLIVTANRKGYGNAMADSACALENMIISTLNDNSFALPSMDKTRSFIVNSIISGISIENAVENELVLDGVLTGNEAIDTTFINNIKGTFAEYDLVTKHFKKVVKDVKFATDYAEQVGDILCNHIKGAYVISTIANYVDDSDNLNLKEAVIRLYAKYNSKTSNPLISAIEKLTELCVDEGISTVTKAVFERASTGVFANAMVLSTLIDLGIDITNKCSGVEANALSFQDFMIQRDYYAIAERNYSECFAAIQGGDTSEETIRRFICAFDLAKETCLRVHQSGLDMESNLTIYINYQLREEVEAYITEMKNVSLL